MKIDLHPDRLLDRREVHEIYGIPVRFLEVAAMRGDGPAMVRVGRLVRYRVSDILDWLDRQTVPASSGEAR